jgi:hypothetical protein
VREAEKKVRQKVQDYGAEILTISKKNSVFRYTIKCKHGHKFDIAQTHLLYRDDQWCCYYPCCRDCQWGTKKGDEQGLRIFREKLHEVHSGKIECLETAATGKLKFNFRCKDCGYTWSHRPTYQISPRTSKGKPAPGCHQCGRSKPLSREDIFSVCAKLDIEIIGEPPANATTKFDYRCISCESEETMTVNQLKEREKSQIGFCDCSRSRSQWTIERAISEGRERGFELLSPLIGEITYFKKLKWRCEHGHATSFSVGSLRSGCLTCFRDKQFTSISDVKKWLKENEPTIKMVPGQKWDGQKKQYSFKCSVCGEIFEKPYTHVVADRRQLCPNAARKKNFSETVVKQYLEKLLDVKFVMRKRSYDWLVNEEGNNMELDGYCGEKKIAFEHHGMHHYSEDHKWHEGDKRKGEKRKKDDDIKRRFCRENGVKLIEIPALFDITPLSELKALIRKELIRLEIPIPTNFESTNPSPYDLNNEHVKARRKSK